MLHERLGTLLKDGLVVAFSGGVDSAFLLWAAERARRDSGGTLVAFTTVSPSVPAADLDDGSRFAKRLGVEHVMVDSDEMSAPAYVKNDLDRCYHCKTELFTLVERFAEQRDLNWMAYGYTYSDRDDVRPGHVAAVEHGVLSPLADVQITKEEIRSALRAFDVEMAEKPSSPCLSSRVMTGLEITPKRLRDVEAVESILREGGIKVLRVRVCGEGESTFLRIEVADAEIARTIELREAVVAEGKRRGYRWVMLDLEGYRTGGGRV
ncbi:MAG: ATP-dependent sacrificial sulfur transferase LarE [Gemmatimonadales bacterium]